MRKGSIVATGIGAARADIHRLDSIRIRHVGRRRHVIVETAVLVIGDPQARAFPELGFD